MERRKITVEIEIDVHRAGADGARVLQLVEHMGEMTADDGRKIGLARTLNGVGFRLGRDGDTVTFGIKPLLDAVAGILLGDEDQDPGPEEKDPGP